MRVLLDTNIIIHREASTAVKEDIGVLFKWLDDLRHSKCVHPVSVLELERHKDPKTRQTLKIKLGSYHVLQSSAPMAAAVSALSDRMDKDDNDRNDSVLVSELYNDRVDILLTEDRNVLGVCRRTSDLRLGPAQ